MLARLRATVSILREQSRWGDEQPHVYSYNFEPAQLCFLASEVERTDPLPGSVLEVGCEYGRTTVFLDRHMTQIGSQKSYYALDTFRGFTPEDVAEDQKRGRDWEYAEFRENSQALFERTLERNGVRRVTAIETDAKGFDFTSIGPFSFCLIDVDLYQPVLSTLNAVWDQMAPGGVIVVDDCDPEHPLWRGSYEAYIDFIADNGRPKDIRHTKLGILQR